MHENFKCNFEKYWKKFLKYLGKYPKQFLHKCSKNCLLIVKIRDELFLLAQYNLLYANLLSVIVQSNHF